MATSTRLDELKRKFDDNPRRYFAPLANEYRKQGDVAQAIALCRTHLPNQPGHISGHIVLAQALYESRELVESRHAFELALDLDPENLIALRYLGDIARLEGAPSVAQAWYQRVLEADPRNEEIAGLLRDVEAEAASAIAELASRPTPPANTSIREFQSEAFAATPPSLQPPVLSFAAMDLDAADLAAPAVEEQPSATDELDTPEPQVLELEDPAVSGASIAAPPTSSLPLELDLPEVQDSERKEDLALPGWDDPFAAAHNSPGELEAVAEPSIEDWFSTPVPEAAPQAASTDVYFPDLADAEGLPQYVAPEPAQADEPAPDESLVSWEVDASRSGEMVSDAEAHVPEAAAGMDIVIDHESEPAPASVDLDVQVGPVHDQMAEVPPEVEAIDQPAIEEAPATPGDETYDWVTGVAWPASDDTGEDAMAVESGEPDTAVDEETEVVAIESAGEYAWAEPPRQDSPEIVGDAEVEPDVQAATFEAVFPEASLEPEPADEAIAYPWDPVTNDDIVAEEPLDASATTWQETPPSAWRDAPPEERVDAGIDVETPAGQREVQDPLVGRTPLFNESVPEPPAPFVTETMAELYLQQGFNEEALAIYRQLLAQSPDDEELQRRVAALEQDGEVVASPGEAQVTSAPAQSVRHFFAGFATRVPRAKPAGETEASAAAAFHAGTSGVATSDEAMTRPDEAHETLTQVFVSHPVSNADARAAAALASAFGIDAGPGGPAAAGQGELSLGGLFRDVGAGPSDAVTTAGYASGSTPALPGDASGAEVESHADVEQFTAWLEGLKKK